MTNATKANIIIAINSVLMLAVAFGAPITDKQIGAIGVAANALLALFVGVSFKNSKKRLPDGLEVSEMNGGTVIKVKGDEV